MRPILFNLLTLLFCLNSFGETTVIQGTIKGFEGENIRLAYIEDYISFNKEHLAEAKINNEQFRLEFDLDQTRQLVIEVQDKKTSLFAEIGQVYNIFLSYNDETNTSRAFEKYLDLKFSFPKADELNQKIKKFNKEYQDFFSQNYKEFVVKEATVKLDSFIQAQESKEFYAQPEYLKIYVNYALANLKDINQRDKSEIYTEYLKGKKVLPNHKEYMNFFSQFYEEDFQQLLITKKGAEIMKAMMFEKDLDKAFELSMQAKNFEDRELAELYMIQGLFEVYHKKTIEQKSNLDMLAKLAKNASSEELRTTASNVRAKLEISSENSKAIAFELENSKSEMVSLDDLKGKPIYMGFWANWSVLSLRELKLMERLQKEYGDQVHFISINIDEDKSIFKEVKANNSYEWTFLYAGKEYKLREQYEVKTAPIYYLIDEQGHIIQRFAPGPQHIERSLKQLIGSGS